MERWFGSQDRDIVWVMRQNLKKKRLERMDTERTGMWSERML